MQADMQRGQKTEKTEERTEKTREKTEETEAGGGRKEGTGEKGQRRQDREDSRQRREDSRVPSAPLQDKTHPQETAEVRANPEPQTPTVPGSTCVPQASISHHDQHRDKYRAKVSHDNLHICVRLLADHHFTKMLVLMI